MKTVIHSLMYMYKIRTDENYPGLWYGSLCQSILDLNLPPNSAFPFFDRKITDAHSSVIYNLYAFHNVSNTFQNTICNLIGCQETLKLVSQFKDIQLCNSWNFLSPRLTRMHVTKDCVMLFFFVKQQIGK